MIIIQNRNRKIHNIKKDYPDALILDVTSRAEMPMVRLSPFYPIGDIPIPFSPGSFSQSVEGIWQGLKVFEYEDIDTSKFEVTSMKGLKRTVRKFGTPKGHRKGIQGKELLDYITARKLIYLPAYTWALDNRLQKEIDEIRKLSETRRVVLLDFETNGDIDNPEKPLSHAHLIKMRLEGKI